jgi:hypothetical protein
MKSVGLGVETLGKKVSTDLSGRASGYVQQVK